MFLLSCEATGAPESTAHLLKVLPTRSLSAEMRINFMQSEVTWGEASLLLTRLCAILQTQRWLHLGDIRAGKDHVQPKEMGPPLAQDRGRAGRKSRLLSFLGSSCWLLGWLLPACSGLPLLLCHPRLRSMCV